MNLHMPQDPESEAELRNLAAIPYQIISPGNNTPIIGIFQDSMLGSFQFTRENVVFTKRDAMNLLMMCNRVNENTILEKEGPITSFDIITQIIPPLSLYYKTKLFKEGDDVKTSNGILEIKNGNYIRGQIDKGVVGSGTKGLIHRICNDFGNIASAQFIDDLQNVVTSYLKTAGFSVGISDLIINDKTKTDIITTITNKKIEVKNLLDRILLGVFDNNTGKSNVEEFETEVDNIMKKAFSDSEKIIKKKLTKDNRFSTMVAAGSKGSDLNISFMISCLGQQNVDGKRIPYGFENRTLPHYTKFDDSPVARGFVENCYINGLSPQELFFHAMGGRVGLIDTAVKTSTTGYIQRRLIKGLEDLMVNYDMTIRTNKGKIVQFQYGEDGIDTTKVENQILPLVNMSIQEIYAHYNLLEEAPGKTKTISTIFLKNTLARHKKQAADLMIYGQKYTDLMIDMRKQIVDNNVLKKKDEIIVNSPVAFQHIIQNVQGQLGITSSSLVDITIVEAYQLIEQCYEKLDNLYYSKPTLLFKTLFFFYLSPKELLVVKRLNKSALVILLEKVITDYKKAIVAPGEMVGLIAGQSIGEISTQMTLNSVTYETPIIVRNRNGDIQKLQIGDFIEKHIKTASSKNIEYYKDKDTTYAALDKEPTENCVNDNYYEVPSCDEDGNILWKRIEAVTRHPVVNEDGTNTMLKITTHEQREVVVTKAKSLLKLVDGKIIPINGDSLRVGDYVPISKKQIDFTENKELDLRSILPPTEYIYSTEVEKARTTFQPNCVYTKQTNMNDYQIPEKIKLDYRFGYLLGAYAAEGCMTKTQISISNNDMDYLQPILELCKEWNITTKIYTHQDKNQKGWKSQDVRIYNTVLCRILENLCGKLSHNKFVSDKIIFSNKECLLGFLDAYIGGDGTVNTRDRKIIMSSVSKDLLIDVQQMLNILDVYTFISKPTIRETNNRRSKNIKQVYSLHVHNNQAKILASMLHMKIKSKQEKLSVIINHKYKYNINRNELTVPNEVDGVVVYEERSKTNKYVDVVFDKIKEIEEVPNTTNYAYDLTVEDTRTFNFYNGLCGNDTFHFAGVASKSNVTRGVPRIEEILSLSPEPKNQSLTVFLREEDEINKDRAMSLMYMLEHTRLEEIVKSVKICFDPDDLNTLIQEDRALMEQYKAFETMVEECATGVSETTETDGSQEQPQENTNKSKWVIRLEMDPEQMLEKNITMDDVHFTLNASYDNQLSCVYSDYNADNLVFRIRLQQVVKEQKASSKKKVNPLDQTDEIYILKNFQENLLQNVILRGVKGINKVTLRKIKDNMVEKNGVYSKQDIWVLDTVGTNLLDVLALDYVDSNRTFSNNIMEVFNVLGIEAARNSIYNELVDVVEFDGTYVNYHNYSVLVDRMTFNSRMISIFRHGINSDDIGPIAKASFEETPEMFLKAARHGELDNMKGISANVMCGQEGFFGTSAFQVFLDLKEMQKLSSENIYVEKNIQSEIDAEFGFNETGENDTCSKTNLSIQNNVLNIKKEEVGIEESEGYSVF
jgi:DNA-directed RNA polymerase beta' subunit